jgi:hypothetical protein
VDKISYRATQVRSGMYYLSVYGHEHSDFVVNVIIRRQQKNPRSAILSIISPANRIVPPKTQLTEFQLVDGIAQLYSL